MNVFAQLTKVDAEKRLVYGRAADETPDRAGEIFDYDSSKPLFQKWSNEALEASDGQSFGNLRSMHKGVAAGKMVGIDFDDSNKAIDICAKVVDDNEWKKVLEGVYTGFSIGGSYAKKWDDSKVTKRDGKPATRYTAAPNEISLVDRPSNPGSKFFSLQKADGSTEEVEFQAGEEQPEPVTDPADLGKVEEPAGLEKAADPVEYQVEGTDDEVAKLAQIMHDESLTMSTVLKFVDAGLVSLVQEKEAAEVLKLEETGTLKKGMYAVAELASTVQRLEQIRSMIIREEEAEGDVTSLLPEKATNMLTVAVDLLVEMVREESAEMTQGIDVTKLAACDGLAKAGARNSAMDASRIQKMHDLAIELGGSCPAPAEKADEVQGLAKADLAKFEDAIQKFDSLTSELQAVHKAHDELMEKVAKLEAQPAPARGVLRALSKGFDTVTGDEAPLTQPVVKNDQVNEAATLIKMAHQSGGVPMGLRSDGSPIR